MASRNEIMSYLKVAARIAGRGEKRRTFLLGAVGVRRDGAMVSAFNGPTPKPDKRIHAEFRLSKKLDVGAVVYVARIMRMSNEFTTARPCDNCIRVLAARGVKRIYYTIGPNEFGRLDL